MAPDSRIDLLIERSDARWCEACKYHALRSSVALPVPRCDLVEGTATDACTNDLETRRLHGRGWFAGADDAFTSVVQDPQRAGGGVKRGVILGSSDALAELPKDRPISHQDVLATMYHILGVDYGQSYLNEAQRPVQVLNTGEPIREILS